MGRGPDQLEQRGAVKVTVELATDYANALQAVADKRGIITGQVLAQGISTEVFVLEQERRGGQFLIEDRKGVVRDLDFARRATPQQDTGLRGRLGKLLGRS